MSNITTEKVSAHIDELFQDTINISREVRELELPEKQEHQILRNFEKVIQNLLVASKRLHKIKEKKND